MPLPDDIITDRTLVPGPSGTVVGGETITSNTTRITALEALPVPLKGIITGRHYGPLDSLSGWPPLTNFNVGANFLNASAFLWPANAVIVGAKIAVVTPQPTATIRLAIYSFGANGLPDAKVLDLGVADLSVAGDRVTVPVNATLARGTYYLAGAVNVASVVLQATVSGPGVTSVLGHLDTTGTTPRSSVIRGTNLTSGFTGLPNPFGAASTGAIIPAFWLVAG